MPDLTPSSTHDMTINGQPATAEQMAQVKSLAMMSGPVGLLIGLILVAAMWGG